MKSCAVGSTFGRVYEFAFVASSSGADIWVSHKGWPQGSVLGIVEGLFLRNPHFGSSDARSSKSLFLSGVLDTCRVLRGFGGTLQSQSRIQRKSLWKM